MKKIFVRRIICILIGICFLIPANLLSIKEVGGDEESISYLYISREGESWDQSGNYSAANWKILNGICSNNKFTNPFKLTASSKKGDYTKYDFTVYDSDTYKFWIRGRQRSNACQNISLKWDDNIIGYNNWYGTSTEWKWYDFGTYTLPEGKGSLYITYNYNIDDKYLEVDNILITNKITSSFPGNDENGSITHEIGEKPTIFPCEDIPINTTYIKTKTENLSDIIFDIYDPGDIAKGRAFGTEGELVAYDRIKAWLEDLDLFVSTEPILFYPSDTINNKLEVISKELVINDEEVECYIGPRWNNSLFEVSFNYDQLSHCFSYNNLDVKRRLLGPHTTNESFDELYLEFLEGNLSDIIDDLESRTEVDYNSSMIQIINATINEFEYEQGFTFENLDPENTNTYPEFFNDVYVNASSEPYVFIEEDPWNNPDFTPILGCLDPIDPVAIYLKFTKYVLITAFWNHFNDDGKDNCKGLILYDFNDDTHNMINTLGMSLPLIFINGTEGTPIDQNPNSYSVNFTIDQYYNNYIESYNVIGTIYGEDPSKTIIVCSLYDSWWNQGTADSAIGMSIVLSIARYFVENNITPKYNLKFIAFGGEELDIKGATSYERRHKDDNIIAVIDLNQLGFEEDSEERLTFYIITNGEALNSTIKNITEKSDYVDRTYNHADFETKVINILGLSNYYPFLKASKWYTRDSCDTICFLKDTGWTQHHRDNITHLDGDTIDYYNETYVSVVAEMVLNVTYYYASEIEIPLIINESADANIGFNLITIPFETDLYASDLADLISGCLQIAEWNRTNQDYNSPYIIGGPPDFDFQIQPRRAIWVEVSENSTLSFRGLEILNKSIDVNETLGWHMIGWFNHSNIMSSSLAENITNCDNVNRWDSNEKTYYPYIVGGPPDFDFEISRGMGLFVETKIGDSGGGGTPNLPHHVYGQAFYGDTSRSADGANVTIKNENTSEQLYTTVGEEASEWYIRDIGELPSGWNHSHIINVTINGTKMYSDWTGYSTITCNNSTGIQKIANITLTGNSVVIRDDDGTMENYMTLDAGDDMAVKHLNITGLSKLNTAYLWIYGKGFGTYAASNDTYIMVNDNSSNKIYFNPITSFGTSEYNWQSFSINFSWLSTGLNNFTFFDTGRSSSNNMYLGIDNETDNNRSQWVVDSGSEPPTLPPVGDCEGELMVVLVLKDE